MIRKNKPPKLLIFVFYSTAMAVMLFFVWNEQTAVRRGGDNPLYLNLMEQPVYVRKGFEITSVLRVPEIFQGKEAVWALFESRPLRIRNAPLPDMPRRPFLSPWGRESKEFTILIPLEINDEAFRFLENNPTVMPGIFLASIGGENWEIYFICLFLWFQILIFRSVWNMAP